MSNIEVRIEYTILFADLAQVSIDEGLSFLVRAVLPSS